MKVLQINSVCGIGSTGRIAVDIHNLLLEQGHDSYIAYGREKSQNCNHTIKIGNKLDFYFHLLLTRVFDKHGFGSKHATKKFIKRIQEIDPDIIHLHNIHGYYLHFGLLFSYLKERQKPVVWTLHDCWSFTGHCSYFDYVGCDKWKTECKKCPEKKSYPKSVLFDSSKHNYKIKKEAFTSHPNLTIVTPSNWLKNLVEISFLKKYNVKVINNGINLNVFKPNEGGFRQKYGLENKYLILGVASVWDRRKGLNYFIELNNLIDLDTKIVLVGLSKKQLKEIPKNIVGISRTENVQELVNIYSSCDLFINPTLEDNFPTTNIEALACGIPVITFNTGGSPEIINSQTGISCNDKNAVSLVSSIEKIRKSNIDYKNNCVIRATKLYDKNQRFKEYLELYKDLNI